MTGLGILFNIPRCFQKSSSFALYYKDLRSLLPFVLYDSLLYDWAISINAHYTYVRRRCKAVHALQTIGAAAENRERSLEAVTHRMFAGCLKLNSDKWEVLLFCSCRPLGKLMDVHCDWQWVDTLSSPALLHACLGWRCHVTCQLISIYQQSLADASDNSGSCVVFVWHRWQAYSFIPVLP